MQTPIPLRSDPLSTALDWSRRMGQRAQRDAACRISRALWAVAVEAAMARGHMAVAANLLSTELVPALGEAMEALGQAVTLAATPPLERHPSWPFELLPRLDRIVHRYKHGCDTLVVAEQRAELALDGPPPLCRDPDGADRVLERVLGDLALELDGRDPWAAVAERLGRALVELVAPVDALVGRIDADDLDGAPLVPLKRAMLVAYEDLCEALLLALARLDLESVLPPPRARASA